VLPVQQLVAFPLSAVPVGMQAHVPLLAFPVQQLVAFPLSFVPVARHAHVPPTALPEQQFAALPLSDAPTASHAVHTPARHTGVAPEQGWPVGTHADCSMLHRSGCAPAQPSAPAPQMLASTPTSTPASCTLLDAELLAEVLADASVELPALVMLEDPPASDARALDAPDPMLLLWLETAVWLEEPASRTRAPE
jgi:hypothetical protein